MRKYLPNITGRNSICSITVVYNLYNYMTKLPQKKIIRCNKNDIIDIYWRKYLIK